MEHQSNDISAYEYRIVDGNIVASDVLGPTDKEDIKLVK